MTSTPTVLINITSQLLFTDGELLEALREASYDVGARVPTYCEFDGQRRRNITEQRPGLRFVETYRHLPDEGLRRVYIEYIAGRFDRGAIISDKTWRMLSVKCRTAISLTMRGRAGKITATSATVSNCPVPNLDERGDPVFCGRGT